MVLDSGGELLVHSVLWEVSKMEDLLKAAIITGILNLVMMFLLMAKLIEDTKRR